MWEKIAEASALKKKTKAQQKANTEDKGQTEGKGKGKGGRKGLAEEKGKGGSRRSPRNTEEQDDKMQVRLLHHTFLSFEHIMGANDMQTRP